MSLLYMKKITRSDLRMLTHNWFISDIIGIKKEFNDWFISPLIYRSSSSLSFLMLYFISWAIRPLEICSQTYCNTLIFLIWHFLVDHLLILVVSISNHKIDLRTLITNIQIWLFLQSLFDFLILNFIQNSL